MPWPQIGHLFLRSWDLVKSWNSATTFSIIRDFIIVALVFAVTARWTLGKEWYKPKVLLSGGKGLLITTAATLLGLLAVLLLVICVAVPVAIYSDHQDLVKERNSLVSQRDKVTKENQALQSELDRERNHPHYAKVLPGWQQNSSVQGGPFGPIFAFEMIQEFKKLPKPCAVILRTAKDKKAFRDVFVWLLTEGAECTPKEALEPPNIDASVSYPDMPTTPGMVMCWREGFVFGERIANFFDSGAIKVSVSHNLPKNSPSNLIWIDVGPGSPFKP